MEILLGLAGLTGLALLLQSKSLPSEGDFKKAKEKLDTNLTDPDANTVVGKYIAFVQGDISAAMPYLVHSSDKTLKALAEHELDSQHFDTAPKKVGMGDEWVTAAKNFKPLYRFFYDRASYWYAQAWSDLDGIWKDKLRERFRKLLLLPAPGGIKNGPPAGWNPDGPGKLFTDGTVAHNGGRSLRLDGGKEKNALGYSGAVTPVIVAPKGQVTLSAWVASDGTDSASDRLVINFVNANGGFAGANGPLLPVDNPFWQKVETVVNVPKEAARMGVGVLLYSGKGTLWIDDISVKSNGKELLENGSFDK